MLRSLVGSEMCIRDRHQQRSPSHYQQQQQQQQGGQGVGGVCKDHIVGRCIRPNCRFLHLPNSVRPLPEDVCKDYARGSCGRPVCRFFHGSPEELVRLKGLQRSHPELLITSTGEALTAERIQAVIQNPPPMPIIHQSCLLYTSDAADEEDSVDLGGRRIIKKKKKSILIKKDAHKQTM
eukprot:TRINITY_DN63927_c0_g1_i1.p1 TRINITY_DN63927_c0_g1~~TRINITY_DN63927_c0_g1_i1.p1  ORF type:complete len:179 (-),score=53.73 TRINITY_DN63927_c0_g1_i1:70-606(-)